MPAKLIAMRQANLETAQLKLKLLGQGGMSREIAAVTMHGMNNFPSEDIQRKDIHNVTGMNDDLAVSEAVTDSIQEIWTNVAEMGVGEDACFDHDVHGVGIVRRKCPQAAAGLLCSTLKEQPVLDKERLQKTGASRNMRL